MTLRRTAFDLALAYPQWQGSGRHQYLPRGAEATAAVCGRYAPLLHVPAYEGPTQDAHGVNRWDAVFAQFRSAHDLLARSGARHVLTAGGDCAVDVAVIGYLNGLHPGLQVIWIDAHADGNTPATSPSGNFHGMPVSAILGRAPELMRPYLGEPVDPARFRYFGRRPELSDEGDRALQRELNLQALDPQASVAGPVHIHFDLDVLDPQEFPFVAYPDGKLTVDDAVALLRRIAGSADVVGLTITEFAPADEAAADAGSQVIARLCDAITVG